MNRYYNICIWYLHDTEQNFPIFSCKTLAPRTDRGMIAPCNEMTIRLSGAKEGSWFLVVFKKFTESGFAIVNFVSLPNFLYFVNILCWPRKRSSIALSLMIHYHLKVENKLATRSKIKFCYNDFLKFTVRLQRVLDADEITKITV